MAVKISPDYIDLLNKAVEREIQVSLQYILQHAKMEKLVRRTIPENILLDKTTYDAVGKFLREISIQEMKHAASIMERIYYLGGQASTKSAKVTIGDSISEFAKLGVKAEEEALTLYREIIETAGKMGDWETRELFEKIYGEEEGHLFKFQEYTKFQDEKDEPSKVPLPEWRKIYTDDYFTLLNKAVSAEITGIIQYTNQHEKMAFLELRMKNTALRSNHGNQQSRRRKQNPQRSLHAGNGPPRKNQRTHLPPRRRSNMETRSITSRRQHSPRIPSLRPCTRKQRNNALPPNHR